VNIKIEGKNMQTYKMIIDGGSVSSDKTFEVINPALGSVFASCALGNPATLDMAVVAARKAFPLWSRLSHEERLYKMNQLAGCSGQVQPDTFLKEFSYSTGDWSSFDECSRSTL
jgi:delta 1-pyrroline-5-carboxylate dehydrogenase